MRSTIPIAIVGAHKFYETLTNLLSILGYWASMFGAIVLVEHFIFRHNSFASYDLRHWNSPQHLPTGFAALGAGILACGLIIPSMDQAWWVGPIGKKTGDIGFEVAFAATGLIYIGTRKIELMLSSKA